MIPALPAARVIGTSPSSFASPANAAGLTKIGNAHGIPRIEVVMSISATGRRLEVYEYFCGLIWHHDVHSWFEPVSLERPQVILVTSFIF